MRSSVSDLLLCSSLDEGFGLVLAGSGSFVMVG
jgi:hypothetical protein